MSTLSLEDVTIHTTIKEIMDADLDWDDVYHWMQMDRINEYGVFQNVIFDTFINLHSPKYFESKSIKEVLRIAEDDLTGCYNSVKDYVVDNHLFNMPDWLEGAIDWEVVKDHLNRWFCEPRIKCDFKYITFVA